jgi:holo-[acyl-carrier protein] synthase
VIFGVGTDIVQISRIRADLERYGDRFTKRVLTTTEYDEYRTNNMAAQFVAKRFAAKEAAVKALGIGFREGLSLRQIGVFHDGRGRPGLEFHGRALEFCREFGFTASHVSIADENEYAIAFVTLVTGGFA